MITAIMHRNGQGVVTGFEISGHADYAEAGSDIICAAVSAIAYTAIGYFCEKWYGGKAPEYSERDGFLQFWVPERIAECEAYSSAADAVMEAAAIGFKQIELSYGAKYIKVIDEIDGLEV